MDNNQGRVRRETPSLLGIDLADPTQVARFCHGLGYSEDSVVNALVQHCKLDRLIAQRIVSETTQTTGGA
jgi:hypothetical protein